MGESLLDNESRVESNSGPKLNRQHDPERGRLIKTWLSQKPEPMSNTVSLLVAFIIVVVTQAGWMWPRFGDLLTVSGASVFGEGQYWRPWTACFAHADIGHLLSNLLLLVVLGRYLVGHFGLFIYPVVAFVLGGFANLVVLGTYEPSVEILGASGVVNVVGGLWLSLYFFISRQYRMGSRLVRTFGVLGLLFLPQEFRPHVADRVHFAGLVLGLTFGTIWFFVRRPVFRAAEVWYREPDLPETDSAVLVVDSPHLPKSPDSLDPKKFH